MNLSLGSSDTVTKGLRPWTCLADLAIRQALSMMHTIPVGLMTSHKPGEYTLVSFHLGVTSSMPRVRPVMSRVRH